MSNGPSVAEEKLAPGTLMTVTKNGPLKGLQALVVEDLANWVFVIVIGSPVNPGVAQTPSDLWWEKHKHHYCVLKKDLARTRPRSLRRRRA